MNALQGRNWFLFFLVHLSSHGFRLLWNTCWAIIDEIPNRFDSVRQQIGITYSWFHPGSQMSCVFAAATPQTPHLIRTDSRCGQGFISVPARSGTITFGLTDGSTLRRRVDQISEGIAEDLKSRPDAPSHFTKDRLRGYPSMGNDAAVQPCSASVSESTGMNGSGVVAGYSEREKVTFTEGHC